MYKMESKKKSLAVTNIEYLLNTIQLLSTKTFDVKF